MPRSIVRCIIAGVLAVCLFAVLCFVNAGGGDMGLVWGVLGLFTPVLITITVLWSLHRRGANNLLEFQILRRYGSLQFILLMGALLLAGTGVQACLVSAEGVSGQVLVLGPTGSLDFYLRAGEWRFKSPRQKALVVPESGIISGELELENRTGDRSSFVLVFPWEMKRSFLDGKIGSRIEPWDQDKLFFELKELLCAHAKAEVETPWNAFGSKEELKLISICKEKLSEHGWDLKHGASLFRRLRPGG